MPKYQLSKGGKTVTIETDRELSESDLNEASEQVFGGSTASPLPKPKPKQRPEATPPNKLETIVSKPSTDNGSPLAMLQAAQPQIPNAQANPLQPPPTGQPIGVHPPATRPTAPLISPQEYNRQRDLTPEGKPIVRTMYGSSYPPGPHHGDWTAEMGEGFKKLTDSFGEKAATLLVGLHFASPQAVKEYYDNMPKWKQRDLLGKLGMSTEKFKIGMANILAQSPKDVVTGKLKWGDITTEPANPSKEYLMGKGVANVPAGLLNDPLTTIAMLGTGGLGKLGDVAKIIQAAFESGYAITMLGENAPKFKDAIDRGDYEAAGEYGAGTAMGTLAGLHLLKSGAEWRVATAKGNVSMRLSRDASHVTVDGGGVKATVPLEHIEEFVKVNGLEPTKPVTPPKTRKAAPTVAEQDALLKPKAGSKASAPKPAPKPITFERKGETVKGVVVHRAGEKATNSKGEAVTVPQGKVVVKTEAGERLLIDETLIGKKSTVAPTDDGSPKVAEPPVKAVPSVPTPTQEGPVKPLVRPAQPSKPPAGGKAALPEKAPGEKGVSPPVRNRPTSPLQPVPKVAPKIRIPSPEEMGRAAELYKQREAERLAKVRERQQKTPITPKPKPSTETIVSVPKPFKVNGKVIELPEGVTAARHPDPMYGGYDVTYDGKTHRVYFDRQSQMWHVDTPIRKGVGSKEVGGYGDDFLSGNDLSEAISDLKRQADSVPKPTPSPKATLPDSPKPVEPPKTPTYAEAVAGRAAEARARIAERKAAREKGDSGTLNTGPNVFKGLEDYDVSDIIAIGADHIVKGATKFAEWSKGMVTDFGKVVEPHLPKLWKQTLDQYHTDNPEGKKIAYTIPRPKTTKATLPDKSKKLPSVTGGRNDITDTERKALGLPEVSKQAYVDVEESYQKGKEAVSAPATDDGRIDPRKLAEELQGRARDISAVETGALIYDRTRIHDEYNTVGRKLDAAIKAGPQTVGGGPDTIKKYQEQLKELTHLSDTNSWALQVAGRKWSEAGRARQALADLKGDYTDPLTLIDNAARKRGKPLSDAEKTKYREMAEELKKAQDRNKVLETAAATKKAQAAVDRVQKSSGRQVQVETIEARRAELGAILQKKFASTGLQSGGLAPLFDVETMQELGEYALTYARVGLLKLEDVLEKVKSDYPHLDDRTIRDAISGYYEKPEKVSPKSALTQGVESLKKEARLVSRKEDLLAQLADPDSIKAPTDNGRAAKKTALEEEVAKLDKQIADILRKRKAVLEAPQRQAQAQARRAEAQNKRQERKTEYLKTTLTQERAGTDTRKRGQGRASTDTPEQAAMRDEIGAIQKVRDTQKKVDSLKRQLAQPETIASKSTYNGRPSKTVLEEEASLLEKQKTEVLRVRGLQERLAKERAGEDTRTGKKSVVSPAVKDLNKQIGKERSERDRPAREAAAEKRSLDKIEAERVWLQDQLDRGDYTEHQKKQAEGKARREAAAAKLSPEMRKAREDVGLAKQKIRHNLEAEAFKGLPKWAQWATTAYSFPRDILVFGHGTTSMITHGGGNLMRPSSWKAYWPNFFRQFGYMLGKPEQVGGKLRWTSGKAYRAAMMETIESKADYKFKLDAGLAISPEVSYNDWQRYGTGIGAIGRWGNDGFDALKSFRDEYFDLEWDKIDPSEQTPERAKLLAQWINHATGTSNIGRGVPARIAEGTMFAPRLMGSRLSRTMGDPARTAIGYFKPGEERAMSWFRTKRAAELVVTYASALAVNQAFLSYAKPNGKDTKINFRNPSAKDWLRFKDGDGKTFDFDGNTTSAINLLALVVYTGEGWNPTHFRASKADEEYGEIGTFVRFQGSPQLGYVADILNSEDFKHRPLPWAKAERGLRGQPKVGWGEYASEHFIPIPFAGGAREVFDAFKEQGLDDKKASDWVELLWKRGEALKAFKNATGPEMLGIKVGKTPKTYTPGNPGRRESDPSNIPDPGKALERQMQRIGNIGGK